MPQLNPSPWFLIMGLSWMVLLILFYPKISTTAPQNSPMLQDKTPHKTSPWNWPWT